MSDDKNQNPSDKQNENNDELTQNESNERNAQEGPSLRPNSISALEGLEAVDDQANIQKSDSDILNFYPDYGKVEGAFIPYIPTTEAFVYMKIPPDGGYAWIILVLSFFNSIIIEGIVFSVGRVLPDLIDEMKISSSTGALVISIQIGLYFASGPISSILVNKIGFRPVAMIGVSMAIFGNIIASLANNIIILLIFFGIVVGFGFGLAILAVQMIVSFYFAKYRAIACGICSAGSGLGILIFSPLNSFITTSSGWRITLRVEALICSLILISSIFYQPVKLTKIGKYVDTPKDEDTLDSFNSVEIASNRYSKFFNSQTPDREASASLSAHQASKARVNLSPPPKPSVIKKFFNKCNCWTCFGDKEKIEKGPAPEVIKIPHVQSLAAEDKRLFRAQSSARLRTVDEKKVPITQSADKKNPIDAQSTIPQKIIIDIAPLDREDIFYDGNPNYQERVNKLDDDNITVLPGKEQQAKAINYTISVMRNTEQQIETQKNGFPHYTFCTKLMSTLHVLFDPRLLHSPEFAVLFSSSFFYFSGGNIPYIYLTNHTEIPAKYSNLLLSLIGLLNTVIRISSGFLAYSFKINPLYAIGIALMCSGTTTFLVGFFGKDILWFQFLYCFVFAVGSGFNASFRSIVIVQLLGLDKLTNAYGFTSLGMGIASFLGTNIGGIIKNNTGKADYAFAFGGTVITTSGILLILLYPIVKCIHREDIKKVRFSTSKTRKV